MKVLLVDPSTTCTLIGRAYLTNYGVKTEAVENAHLAIAMLHTGSSFDLILIAMHMREMNGAQVIHTHPNSIVIISFLQTVIQENMI